MRNQWLRLLLLRGHIQSQPRISRHSQVKPLRHFTSSLLRQSAPHVTLNTFVLRQLFSSSPELAVEPPKPPSDQTVLLADIFAKPEKSADEIKLDLDSNNVVINHDLVLSVLRNAQTAPDVAKRLFNWVLDRESEKLSSKSYNYMLGIFGSNGFVKESWDVIGLMKKKGYGVSKGIFDRISVKFREDGLNDDIEKLKELYASGSASIKNSESSNDNAVEKDCSRACKIIRRAVWGDDVEKELRESVEFSSHLVRMVLENLELELNKGLIFFRWIEESGLFKHEQHTYNALARVLCREECIDKFWRIVNEMRGAGHEMERETYVKALKWFVKQKMIEDAVSLYEFAMIGENKPSVHDCTFLLKKIVVTKELDMDLFKKVVKICKESGNVFTDANLDSILKSLTSVGRLAECNRILEAIEEGGYVPSVSLQCNVAFKLGSGGKTQEALEFMGKTVASGGNSEYRTWVSLIKGYCLARDLDGASNMFRKMVDQEGPSCTGYALELLVDTYCRKNRPFDAYKVVTEMVKDKGLSPWHSTYKTLTSKLLVKKRFNEAVHVMNMMKNHGYPPPLDSFVDYLSKTGSAEDAITFSRAMTSKRFPSTSVFLGLFEAYFKAGRHNEAQDFLSKSPRYIRNHADILNLFCTMKAGDTARTAAVGL